MSVVSVVLPTKDDARDLPEVLAALARQTMTDHEVVIIDAGSVDGTLEFARAAAARDPRIRVLEGPRDLDPQEARSRGVAASACDLVAFLGADAVPEDDWLAALVAAMSDGDAAFGRRLHAPPTLNVPTVARGLRYHIFARDPPMSAVAYASNVNAMWRRGLLERLPFDPRLPAAVDVDLARRAHALGARVVYAPAARVRHKDATTSTAEWRRVRREGRANGRLARGGDVDGSLLLWGGAVLGGVLALSVLPGLAAVAVVCVFLWAPTARRVLVLRPRQYPTTALAAAVLSAPVYDLGYLSGYLQGLSRP